MRSSTWAAHSIDLDPYLLPMVLCADAVLDGDELIGDPTEGALIVLGAKGGLDIDETRRGLPQHRRGPFDSEYKFMAHLPRDDGARTAAPVIRCYVKGAPDVLISQGTRTGHPTARSCPSPTRTASSRSRRTTEMAEGGERVMVVAQRDFDPATSTQAGSDRAGAGPDAARDGRHRRPAEARGQSCDRRVQERRHPGADDHRRPRDHRGRDRRRTRDRGPRPRPGPSSRR